MGNTEWKESEKSSYPRRMRPEEEEEGDDDGNRDERGREEGDDEGKAEGGKEGTVEGEQQVTQHKGDQEEKMLALNEEVRVYNVACLHDLIEIFPQPLCNEGLVSCCQVLMIE